ncbi:hypothetical protein EV363DRAFT_1178020, partial [Boletus edulis]
DHMGERLSECQDCGGYMCEQSQPDGPGCIWAGTLDAKKPFRCIICDPRHWRRSKTLPKGQDGGLQYGFAGYGGRKRAKLTWPMILLTFTEHQLPDRYVQRGLELDLDMQYANARENVTGMEKNGKGLTAGAVSFMQHSINSRLPANTFVVIDMHSGATTGALQWAAGSRPKSGLTSEAVKVCVGEEYLDAMKKAADLALQSSQGTSSKGWYDDSVYFRGGWRGLLLATCAPIMRVKDSFEDARRLVERGVFDFVVGFAGSSTLPTQIRNAFSQLIERIGIDKTAGIWYTILRVIGHDLLLLEVNSVVVIFKERGQSEVMARKIGRHSLPMRPWGVEFRACAAPTCEPTAHDFFVQNDGYGVRMACRWCGWRSVWVKEKDWKAYVFRMDSSLPNVFWHSYPPSYSLQNIFVEATRAHKELKA